MYYKHNMGNPKLSTDMAQGRQRYKESFKEELTLKIILKDNKGEKGIKYESNCSWIFVVHVVVLRFHLRVKHAP